MATTAEPTERVEAKIDARPTPSWRTLLGWAALLVALTAVVAASIVVGYKGPKPGFQWELASIFGTAVGTTLLALATGALAYSTRSDVRATWRLADLTRRDQAERERPVVIQKTAWWAGGGEMGGRQEGRLSVTLLNVGLGPALKVEVTARYNDDQYTPVITPDPYIVPAIPPGKDVAFDITVTFPHKSPREGVRPDGFPLNGTFTDRSRQKTYSIITDWSA